MPHDRLGFISLAVAPTLGHSALRLEGLFPAERYAVELLLEACEEGCVPEVEIRRLRSRTFHVVSGDIDEDVELADTELAMNAEQLAFDFDLSGPRMMRILIQLSHDEYRRFVSDHSIRTGSAIH